MGQRLPAARAPRKIVSFFGSAGESQSISAATMLQRRLGTVDMLWGIFSRSEEGGDIGGCLSFADMPLSGVRFVAQHTDGAPDYLILQNKDRIGSAWNVASAEGNYISVVLQTPVLNGGHAFYPVLLQVGPNRFQLGWDVEDARQNAGRVRPLLQVVR